MSGGGDSEDIEGEFWQHLVALLIIAAVSAIGGFLIKMLAGLKISKNCICKNGLEFKALCTTITIPPLVGMIILGCIARNFFGEFMDYYPNDWAEWIRSICLSVILLRGGLELDFKGKGILVVLLTLTP